MFLKNIPEVDLFEGNVGGKRCKRTDEITNMYGIWNYEFQVTYLFTLENQRCILAILELRKKMGI